MDQKKKEKISFATFLLSGFLFILGGITLIEDDKLVLGGIQLLAGVFNLAIILFKNPVTKTKLEIVILVFNILVATTVAIDYIMEGRKFLQYAWFLAAFLSTVALVFRMKKYPNKLRN
ncbi:MAG: hypothetical protein DHS20C17_19380 [Cyclobacteriaceae bacterium]|nr:MAG: hypothetical protein DHS20C17_19380 [Cyclobacteriaceae bacterium]